MSSVREVPLAEWEQIAFPDVYFTPEYHATSALADPDFDRAVLLEWSGNTGRVYLPLMLRTIEGTPYYDASSAYGYGGPLTAGRPDLAEFKTSVDEWASYNNVVSSFVRFHPILRNVEGFAEIWPVKSIGDTAVWKLDAQDLVQGMAKNHRKNWRRAIRSGVRARVTHKPENIDTFRTLYEASMARLSARSSYWLNDAYWASLRDKLGESSLLVEAVFEDRVVAAAWCLVSDDYLHYHLSGTLDEGRRIGGAYICRVAAAEWARDTGRSKAHHGGGVGGSSSSLLDWKMKFDPSAPPGKFFVAEINHNKDIFQRLSEELPETQYFPPWRDPVVNLPAGI